MRDQQDYVIRGSFRLTATGKRGAYLMVLAPVLGAISALFAFAPAVSAGAGMLAALVLLASWVAFLLGIIMILVGRSLELNASPARASNDVARLWERS